MTARTGASNAMRRAPSVLREHRRRHLGGTVPHADAGAEGSARRAGGEAQPFDAGLPGVELPFAADDDAIAGGVHAQNVEALAGRDPDPAALPDRETVVPGVRADPLPGRVFERSGQGRQRESQALRVIRHEVAGPRPLGHEADLLALFLVRRRQARPARVPPNLRLRELSDGKPRRRELFRRQVPQKVRLVLGRVTPLPEDGPPGRPLPRRADVVARRDRRAAHLPRALPECGELHPRIAGLRRESACAPKGTRTRRAEPPRRGTPPRD